MSAHIDILDQPEPLGKFFFGSVALHVSAAIFLIAWPGIGGHTPEIWGDPNSFGGGAVGVNVVKQIPIPARRGMANPLANETESVVPQVPAKKVESKPEPKAKVADPEAIPIKGRNAKTREQTAQSRYRPPNEYKPNQIYGVDAPALVNPMMGQAGGNGIGVGPGTPFGNRFGYYADILRQKIGEKWNTGGIDPRLQTHAIITFTILRNGAARDVKVRESSGNYLLDSSAMRAIYDASPFPPLPAAYEKSEANIELWFQLKR